jgi:hypothetical protein
LGYCLISILVYVLHGWLAPHSHHLLILESFQWR